MRCIVCDQEVARGHRIKTERYKNLTFCSQACYENHLSIRDKSNAKQNRLKDYIDSLFTNVCWPQVMRQITNLEQDYNLTDNDLRLVIKYAIEYEGYIVDEQYGIGQFEKFIKPSMNFIQSIKSSQAISENIDFNVEIQNINRSMKRKFRRTVDFD